MNLNFHLLSEICKTPGAPGFEGPIRQLVLKELKGLVDECSVDSMGNVIAIKYGKDRSKSILASAHMDEIGFMVTHIDDQGFVYFHTLGGFDPKTLTAQRVIIHGKEDVLGVMGSKPIHIMTAEERSKQANISDYFIDTGLSKSELEERIEIGSPITRERELVTMGHLINAKSLDNRASVFILLESLRSLKKSRRKPSYDFYAVFSVQEEVGLRGAKTATQAIQPDFGIGLDTTIACDTPGTKPQERVTQLGEGAAIKIMDSSCICDARMVDFLKTTARSKDIQWQPEILRAGGTDTAALQLYTAGGSIAGAISLPTRYIHQVIETCHQDDLKGCIQLLSQAVCQIHSKDWQHD